MIFCSPITEYPTWPPWELSQRQKMNSSIACTTNRLSQLPPLLSFDSTSPEDSTVVFSATQRMSAFYPYLVGHFLYSFLSYKTLFQIKSAKLFDIFSIERLRFVYEIHEPNTIVTESSTNPVNYVTWITSGIRILNTLRDGVVFVPFLQTGLATQDFITTWANSSVWTEERLNPSSFCDMWDE
jgi:hypothetical protein